MEIVKVRLTDLGWTHYFEAHFEACKRPDVTVMRVIRGHREKYIACNENGEFPCEVTGKFRFENKSKNQFPTVGDWVTGTPVPGENKALINGVLPRKSVVSRKEAGRITEEQPVAANIDTVFLLSGLDGNFNLRRIERYLSIAWESKAVPVILLNKSDLCKDAGKRKQEVESIAAGVDVHTLSAFNRDDLGKLSQYLKPGTTVAFLGSSGVGKSTLINSLLGTERLKVNAVSDLESRGRHTTTVRELFFLPNGGMVIDTPGMREIQVWGDEEGLDQVFNDIKALADSCRFKDCRHENEPGCAVRAAIDTGSLDPKRFVGFLKLKKEIAYLSDRKTMKASAVEKARWKDISKHAKRLKKSGDY